MKKCIAFCTIIAIIVFSGCQPTPEKAPVTSQAEGLADGVVIPEIIDEVPREIEYPKELV